MAPRRSSSGEGNAALPLFMTVLLIAGVVGVTYLSSNSATPSSSNATSSTSAVVATTSTAQTGPQLAFVTDENVQVVSLDGTARTFSKAEFSQRFADPFRPVLGADVSNGEQKIFTLGSATATLPLPSPDRRFVARMQTPKSDGASVVDFSLPGESAQTVVLRLGAQPIHEATIGVWANSKTLLVSGTLNGARSIFRVSVDGTIAQIATYPDSAIWTAGRASAIWYVTAQAGQGLESDPQPPSELHRVTAESDASLMTDSQRVIIGVVASDGAPYAVRLSDGTTQIRNASDPSVAIEVGKRQAVLFLPDGRLVMRDGFSLVLSDTSFTHFTKITELPPGNVSIFAMPLRLDEMPSTP